MSNQPKSFFRIFNYHNFMDDAIDCGLTYEGIEITKDIETKSGFKLNKGDKFFTCYFLFNRAEFQFINWKEITKYESEPDNARSVYIPQAELAPFLKW